MKYYNPLTILILFCFSLLQSCKSKDPAIITTVTVESLVNASNGDCFFFKDKIRDYGLVFFKENTYPDSAIKFFPVILDTSRTGLDQFRKGKVSVSDFKDLRVTPAGGRTKGFKAFFFLDKQKLSNLASLLNYAGNIPLSENYNHIAGSLSSETLEEFTRTFKHFPETDGQVWNLHPVQDILK